MNINKQTARIIGVLFLTVNVTFLIGALLLENILSASDYIVKVYANETQVILGVLLELTNGIAYLSIAVLMFPLLKKHNESLALGYVGFRIIEFVMQILADIAPLTLLTISQEYVHPGVSYAYPFTIGTLLLAARDWAFLMVTITFSLGALLFYYLLYQLKLLPRFITVWGLIGAAVVLTTDLLGLFANTPEFVGIIMLSNELFLGIWLIVKGFNSSTIAPSSTKQNETS